MNKKLILNIIFLFCLNDNVLADSLPELPDGSDLGKNKVIGESNQSNDERSWWQSFTQFLGFEDEEKKEEKHFAHEESKVETLPDIIPIPDNDANQVVNESQNKISNENSIHQEPILKEPVLTNNSPPISTPKNQQASADEIEILKKQTNKEEAIKGTEDLLSEFAEDLKDHNPIAQEEQKLPEIPTKTPELAAKELVTNEDNKNLAHEKTSQTKMSEKTIESKQSDLIKPVVKIGDMGVDHFKEEIRKNTKDNIKLPKIPDNQVSSPSNNISYTTKEIDDKQLKFVSDEATMLKLQNDDIVLGKMTEKAKLELMDFSRYVVFFWNKYDEIQNADKRNSIEQFILSYDQNFNTEKFLYHHKTNYDGLEIASKAVQRGNIDDLKLMLDNYEILQLTDRDGNSLLHKAAYFGDYPAAKILLMRGIDLTTRNHNNQTAMTIAKRYNMRHITYLLKKATN